MYIKCVLYFCGRASQCILVQDPWTGMPPTGPGQHGMAAQAPMNSPMQQQRRIDPDQMPSPVSVMTCPAYTGPPGPLCTATC